MYSDEQRMVFGANTFRQTRDALRGLDEIDPVNTRMMNMPTTVVSSTLEEPLDWPNGAVARGDAVDVVSALKRDPQLPLRSHGSLSMNRTLMAAGLIDLVQVTIFPVISGQTGTDPILASR